MGNILVPHIASTSAAKVNRLLAAVLLGLLVSLAISRFAAEAVDPLNEDMSMVVQSARVLAETGSLKDVGSSVAFQVLRGGPGFAQPFWFHYLGPVLYFGAIFKILGSSDVAFYAGQIALLVLCAMVLWRKGLRLDEAVGLIALAVLSGTLTGSLFWSPTQLPALTVILFLWEQWDEESSWKSALANGTVAGLGMQFRPETLFVFMLYLILAPRKIAHPLSKRRFSLICAGAFIATCLAFAGARKALGAAGSSDHAFYTLGTNIAARGFGTLSLPEKTSLFKFLSDESLRRALVAKSSRVVLGVLHGATSLWSRPDRYFLGLVFILCLLDVIPPRRYVALGWVLLAQVALNSLVLDEGRYYDYIFFLALCMALQDLRALLWARLERPCAMLALTLAVACWGIDPLIHSGSTLQSHLYWRRSDLLSTGKARGIVPPDAHVITDYWERWQWYGHGRYACFSPINAPETMRRMIAMYPEAYVVLFRGYQRVGASSEGITLPKIFQDDQLLIFHRPDSNPLSRKSG
jgi:hypothetical protein